LLEIFAWRPIDICAAFLERMKSPIEPFDEIRNRAAEVSESPFDAREALDDAAENETRGGERRVQRKADERHQPVIFHRFDADRRSRMNVNHRAEVVRHFPDRMKSVVTQC